jgi:hypothetical protein
MTRKIRRIKRKDYSPAGGVKWAVEEDGILVIDTGAANSLKLNQTESALWQLNTVKTPQSQLTRFLSVLEGIAVDEAGRFIEELYERWRKLGLLSYK